MSGPADRFEAETDALSDVRLAGPGEYLHEYTGVLAETGERVRILAIAPELAELDAAVDAFAQVSDRWYNASANANILTIQDRGTEPRSWIAVPDHGGDTLATLQPDLSPEAIETVISETADALRTLGLYNTVHGHLSPDDIYLPDATEQTETPSVHVGGFGLEAAIQAAVGEFEPTTYTAPELVDNPGKSTEHTDVYGLAAVTYFALTGSPPVAGDDLGQAIRDGPSNPLSAYDGAIPAELDDVVMQALSTLPEDRYDSPYAFSRAFLSTFAPDDFGPDNTGEESGSEAETADSSESDDTASDEDGDDAPSDQDEDSTESDDTDGGSVTRRAAVSLLGMGALGGVGWYLSRGQLTASDPAEGTPTPNPLAEPSANISVTPSNPTVGEEVTLSASESTTGEGVNIDTYEWAIGNETAFSIGAETRTYSFREAGEQTVRLRITDSRSRTAIVTTRVNVHKSIGGVSMFQYDLANTGTSPNETGPQAPISERWSYQAGSMFSSPAVVESTVYVGSEDNNVYALSADDGTEQWTYETGGNVDSSPAVVDGTVYIGSSDENVYALSADDGTEQWTFATGGSVSSSPAVVDGNVYVGSYDNSVYALSVEDGTEQWSYETGWVVPSSPAVVDGLVYIGSFDNSVYGLSVDDGTEQWAYETGGSVVSSPAVVDGTVYIGSTDGNLYALSADDGTERWAFRTGGAVDSSPAVVDGTVYVGSRDNTLYAVSADDGTEQWSYQTGDDMSSSPAMVDDTVYVGSQDHNVYALSAEDGTEQWSYETGYLLQSSPAVVDGVAYIGGVDGLMYALSE